MANCQSIAPKNSGGGGDVFSLNRTTAHITRRANFKQIAPGFVAKKTVMNRIRTVIDGNTAVDRYRRCAFEGSQRVTAAILSEQYRADVSSPDDSVELDLTNNDHVKNRFWRQDNIRFNKAVRTDSKNGTLSKHGKWAMRFSRWAHHANGITELGAAPTGMTQKCIKIASNPKFDDKTERGHWRIFGSLFAVFTTVTLTGKFLSETLGRMGTWASASLQKDASFLAASFSTIAAAASLFSLAFAGCSAIAAAKAPLDKRLVDSIQGNKSKHIERLYLILNDAKNKPTAQTLLMKAMKRGVGKDYRLSDKTPILLHRLMSDVKAADSHTVAIQAMEKTIGSYLTEVDPTGCTTGELLDPKTSNSELLRRENHLVALTNLIEHSAIDGNKDAIFRDTRNSIERGFEKLHEGAPEKRLGCKLLKFIGANKIAERAALKASPEYLEMKEARRKNPLFAHKYYRSAQNILDKSHQYGPVTVYLTRAAEFCRVVNHSILLSFNYQLTRPIAWLSGRITEGALKIPNSRCTSFSIGRFLSSATWAVVEVLVFMSLARGDGIGFNGREADTAVKFPLHIPVGTVSIPISIISTAAQMLVVAVPALIFMGAAKIALEIEGWKGNVERSTQNLHKRRQVMEGWS
ncbi:MAG: hypothetical protein O9274_09305 [Limnobacter sp.]|uniref:hypothetical protein n=1 Tax=Limnobacter sp. TaxID=2003368 RepID=UPI0022C0B776|nr:hypothetical protein [Limnobacter sp.]MCZ8015881.1 hypothetical protein [Limnobacter sp.]